jgi:site-specific DNA-methyltransferase (adenine-specific)
MKQEVWHGDCLELMANIPDKSVDCVICDLPFGVTACEWDKIIDFKLLWAEYKRIVKMGGAICLFGTEPFSSLLRISNLECYKYDWVWDKHIPRGMHLAKVRPMQKHENISIFTSNGETPNYYPIMTLRDKPVKVKNYSKKQTFPSPENNKPMEDRSFKIYTHKGPDSIIVGCWEANGGKRHPTQKPVSACEYLIKTYTKEEELVLDNCAGSGSTLVAAKNLNRQFIGIEKEKEYYEICLQRLGGEAIVKEEKDKENKEQNHE